MTAFNDHEVVRLITGNFVPVATDYRDWKRKDTDGAFFRKVAEPIPYRQSGMSICTADGQVLGVASATTKGEVLRAIRAALPKFEPPAEPYRIEPQGEVDAEHYRTFEPPEGAIVANCIMTHLSERGPGIYPGIDKLLSETVGMDRVWILKEEAEALARDEFPESLKRRIARWHLIDNNWFGQNRLDALRKFDVTLQNGRLAGSVEINGIELDLLGYIEARDGTITRFDIVARGTRRYPPGSTGGYYQKLSTDPYPLAYAFALTDRNHFTYRIPPHTVLSHNEKVYFGN